MLQPLTEHDLLLFWVQLGVLLLTARLLGQLMRRLGQPSVVGELGAGLLIGPSVFGRLFPDAAGWLFPGGVTTSAPILAIAAFGVVMLLTITGFETDLGLLRRLGRSPLTVATGSLALPLAAGVGVGLVLPVRFLGEHADPATFALFLALAISISALAVSGRILSEMNLMRRNIGQSIVAVAMSNELIGWLLLGLLSGVVLSGGLDVGDLATTTLLVAAFFGLALTVGQRAVDSVLRGALAIGTGVSGAFTVSVLIVVVGAAITQLIGVEAAVGAFVAGIVLGRSRYRRAEVVHAFELTTTTVFAPVFFATAGIYVDLGTLLNGRNGPIALAVLAVAVATKFVGSYAGARVARLDHPTSVAMGVGLNARGTLEIVLATIALSLGVFNDVSYATVVMTAMLSSMATAPLLRAALRAVRPPVEEAERLEREDVLASSVVANVEIALVPTRGGENSRLAAQVADLVLKPEASVTILTIHPPDHPDEGCQCQEALNSVEDVFDDRKVERRRTVADDPAAAVLHEAGLGYGLIALGMTEGFRDSHELSPTLRTLLSSSEQPLLLVRHGSVGRPGPPDYDRVVVPATGTRVGRAAEEVAYRLAGRTDAAIDVVHIVPRRDRMQTAPPFASWGREAAGHPTAEGLLEGALQRAGRFGVTARGHSRVGVSAYEGLIETADEHGADAVVLGAQVRSLGGRPFLGHGTEYLLEHAKQTVVVVVFPSEPDNGHVKPPVRH